MQKHAEYVGTDYGANRIVEVWDDGDVGLDTKEKPMGYPADYEAKE